MTLKPYGFVLLFSVLVYPLAWYILYQREAFDLMFGYMPLAILGLVSIAVAAIAGIAMMKQLLASQSGMWVGAVIRIGASTLAGILSPLILFLGTSLIVGMWAPFGVDWWTMNFAPAFVAAFVSYWLTNLLANPVTDW